MSFPRSGIPGQLSFTDAQKEAVKSRILGRISKQKGPLRSFCWLWLGSLSHGGYGVFSLGQMDGFFPRLQAKVHRAAYAAFVADASYGLQVEHLCHNPACCNPKHLKLSTSKTNIRRQSRVLENREFCNSGRHRLSEVGTVPSTGGETCKACRVDSLHKAYLRKKAARHAS